MEHSIKEHFQHQLEFLKLSNDPTRLRLIWLLLIYGKLNLSQLSGLLKRTKPAVTHQLEKFIKLGYIHAQEETVRGSIKAKYYFLSPNFLDQAKIALDPSMKYNASDSKEINLLQLEALTELFTMVQEIFQEMTYYYKTILQKARDLDQAFALDTPPFKFTLLPLTTEQYNEYIEAHNKLVDKIFNTSSNKQETRPFILLNTLLPLKQILELPGQDWRNYL